MFHRLTDINVSGKERYLSTIFAVFARSKNKHTMTYGIDSLYRKGFGKERSRAPEHLVFPRIS